MQERNVDILNFIMGLIKSDAYFLFYFESMCDRMHFRPNAFKEAVAAFDEFRKTVKDEKNRTKNDKSILGVDVTVFFEPEKTKPNKKK